jgi:hypothetical protein
LHISYETILTAIELFNEDPSLESRLWRVAAVHTAHSTLRGMPDYRVSDNLIMPFVERL